MKVAAVQMTSTRDVAANLREAGRLVGDAAQQGAELVVLPENFSFLGATDADRVAAIDRQVGTECSRQHREPPHIQ